MNKKTLNYKKAIIAQIITMYLAHLPFYIVLILARFTTLFEPLLILMGIGIILSIFIYPICMLSIGFAVVNGFKVHEDCTKFVLKSKLALIPWFISNLLVCILLIAGFLNPFLLIAVPLILAIEVGCTYLPVLATSLHTGLYVIATYRKRKLPITASVGLPLILLFFFCLDIPASFMLYLKCKKLEEEETNYDKTSV